MKNKKLADTIAEKLEIPAESFSYEPRLTLFSDTRVQIDNHCGLVLLTKNLVGVKTKSGIYKISGDNLDVDVMTKSQMIITGRIFAFEIEVI